MKKSNISAITDSILEGNSVRKTISENSLVNKAADDFDEFWTKVEAAKEQLNSAELTGQNIVKPEVVVTNKALTWDIEVAVSGDTVTIYLVSSEAAGHTGEGTEEMDASFDVADAVAEEAASMIRRNFPEAVPGRNGANAQVTVAIKNIPTSIQDLLFGDKDYYER